MRSPTPRPGPGRRRAAALAITCLAVSSLAACGSESSGDVVNLYGGAADAGFSTIIKECNQAAKGKYRIVANLLPSQADGQREQLVRRLAAGDKSMDLLGMDVTWTAEFAQAGWIRELTPEQKAQTNKGTLAATVKSAVWKDKQYGIPKHTNVQILWYRKDLVKTPPKTMDEMIQMAKQLKAQGKPHNIGLTAAQYEGYVVNVNTFVQSYGGSIVNADATKATLNSKAAQQGLDMMKKLSTSGVTSPSMSNNTETEIFADLQNGKDAFSVNWPYVLSALRTAKSPTADKLGYVAYPQFVKGKNSVPTTGGMNYAISKFSKHPDAAFDAAMCLRSQKHQLDNALVAGNPPVSEALYKDPKFTKAYPMGQVMLNELKTAKPRPLTPVYQNISTVISTTLNPPSGIGPAAVGKANDQIQEAIDGKGILP